MNEKRNCPELERTGDENTGAFTGATLTLTGTALADAAVPSYALTMKALSVPLALAAGVQTQLSPLLNNVVPGVTAIPPLVNVPLLTASTRNESASPSTSVSSAAAANIA